MLVPRPTLTPDNVGMWGLIGLINNSNLAAPTRQDITTVAGANSTLTPTQFLNGVIILAAGANGGFQLILPSTSSIIDAMGSSVMSDGSFCMLVIVKNNNVGQVATVTAGDVSTTLTGTMTIATNTTRFFLLCKTGAGTLTLENLGTINL